jgi:CheY-specific phosphatase CheX
MTSSRIDATLLACIVEGTRKGLQMAHVDPLAVGKSVFLTTPRRFSVIVGLAGESSGSLTLNISERAILHLASKLLCAAQTEISEDCLDAICEIGNMIAGCTKEALAQTHLQVTSISVPSLIAGANHAVYNRRGLTSVSVEFELEEIPMEFQEDRVFSTSVALVRHRL